jgi:hypothetical protein
VGILRGHATKPVRLHSDWDTRLVERALKKDVNEAADNLMELLTDANKQKWAHGTSDDWAKESYDPAKANAYEGVIDQAPGENRLHFQGPAQPAGFEMRSLEGLSYRFLVRHKGRENREGTACKGRLRLARILQDALQ